MSRATELAEKCGAVFDEDEGLFVMDEHELESLYHATRAEMARELADRLDSMNMHSQEPEWSNGYSTAETDIAHGLRAMADREVK